MIPTILITSCSQRGNGFATYRNSDFFGLVDGLNFAVQYQGKNGSAHGEGMTNNGRDAYLNRTATVLVVLLL